MSKYTPGPWGIKSTETGPKAIFSGETGEWIATTCQKGWPLIDAENARLIAAAPELAEALDSLIGWAVMRSDWAAAGKSEPTDHPIQRARAALKSAGVSHE